MGGKIQHKIEHKWNVRGEVKPIHIQHREYREHTIEHCMCIYIAITNQLKHIVMTIQITKEMIANEICGHLCGIAESVQCSPSPELDDKFVIIKDWDNGQPLTATWAVILKGYHSYGGDDRFPEKTKIPAFISNNWERAERMYMKIKGI